MAESVRRVLREELERRALPGASSSCRGPATTPPSSAAAGVEAGMLFVRSLNGGVSHSPEEDSSAEDVGLAVDVLTATLAARRGVQLASSRALER